MDQFTRLLIQLSQLARRPPSCNTVIAVCVAVVLIILIVGTERFIGWPDALSVNKLPRNPMVR